MYVELTQTALPVQLFGLPPLTESHEWWCRFDGLRQLGGGVVPTYDGHAHHDGELCFTCRVVSGVPS